MSRIKYIIVSVLVLLSATSCLFEQKEFFGETPAERTEEYLKECKDMLTEPGSTWMIEYYPSSELQYGGYTYFLSFTEDEVTAYFQLANDYTESITSLYKLTADDSPSLSYDTYNEFLHYFAEPSQMSYQGLLGDYEFKILSKSEEDGEILLRGRKSGNDFVLKKFDGNVSDYLAKSVNVMETMAQGHDYSIRFKDSQAVDCILEYNTLTVMYISLKGDYREEFIPFCYTDSGVNFKEPVVLGGVEYDHLNFNAANESLVSDNGAFELKTIYLPLKERHFDADDIIDFEDNSEGYFGEWNYYAVDKFNETTTDRIFIGEVTFEDSERPDEEPDDKGIVDEYMEVSGMFPTMPGTKMTFSVYNGIIYSLVNEYGLMTRPSGNQYYLKAFNSTSYGGGYDFPTADYLMIGGYVEEGVVALVSAPENFFNINEIFVGCFESEDYEYESLVGGAEWHSEMIFIRPEFDVEEDVAEPAARRMSAFANGASFKKTVMGQKLDVVKRMLLDSPRNSVETRDGYIKRIIDQL